MESALYGFYSLVFVSYSLARGLARSFTTRRTFHEVSSIYTNCIITLASFFVSGMLSFCKSADLTLFSLDPINCRRRWYIS
jgi:hypothetical protein